MDEPGPHVTHFVPTVQITAVASSSHETSVGSSLHCLRGKIVWFHQAVVGDCFPLRFETKKRTYSDRWVAQRDHSFKDDRLVSHVDRWTLMVGTMFYNCIDPCRRRTTAQGSSVRLTRSKLATSLIPKQLTWSTPRAGLSTANDSIQASNSTGVRYHIQTRSKLLRMPLPVDPVTG